VLAGVAVAVAAIGLAVGLLSARSTTPKQASLGQAAPAASLHPASSP
jgi:hypothetical protein